MTDDFDLQEIEGLTPEQARDVVTAGKEAMRQKLASIKQPADPYAAQEAAEIAELQQRVRGPNYITMKRNIREKYTQLRAEAATAPEKDEELEAAGDDPNALYALYRKRLATIQRGDPMALHRKTEIASPFRKKGLNV